MLPGGARKKEGPIMKSVSQMLPNGFFQENQVLEGTAASVLAQMAAEDLILFPEEAMPDMELSEEEAALAEEVRVCTDPAQLVRYMRKTMTGLLRARVLRRAMAYERDVLPLMQKRALTTQLESFEDCVTMFFLVCKKNPCPWIMEHFDEVRSEFLKSQFCLILGMRGTPKYVDFLYEQFRRYQTLRSEEQYLEQGPLLGLTALQQWRGTEEDLEPKDMTTFFDLPLTVDLPEDLTEEEMREQTKEGSELYEAVKAEAKEYLEDRIMQIRSWYEEGEPVSRIAIEAGLPEEVILNMVNLSLDE